MIAVNLAIRWAPWADALYACDERWWDAYKADWQGTEAEKYTISELAGERYGLRVLENAGREGFDGRPWALKHGGIGGYQAVHLAAHFGAGRIVLLGYDMEPDRNGRLHWHADHNTPLHNPKPAEFGGWCREFDALAQELRKRNIEVVNCSRSTALTCFPRMDLADVL